MEHFVEIQYAARHWTIVGDGKQKVTFTSCRDIGRVVTQALLHTKFANHELIVSSDTLTINEACNAFERAIVHPTEYIKYRSCTE
ncbi:uncharacterized protein VTP21DRAFT_11699 [Calcarisporiella thermophila]|uniref:uncharacterized protein n=1 Tax=Calcarisporiella thermophila TaxID=911321 RepID=UPI003742DE4F